MDYGIQAMEVVTGVYTWRHATLEAAKDAAYAICREKNVEVIVFKIEGSFKPKAEWTEA